ncbi:hypothetical protein ACFX13_016694 [Malus domestica]
MTGFVRTRSKRVTYPLDDRVKDRLVGGYSSGPSDASKGSEHSGDYDSPCLSKLVCDWVSRQRVRLRTSRIGETDNSLDTQVPFLPLVEVSVKALLVISLVALPAAPSAATRVLFCAHHPYLVGTAKRDAVWKVNLSLGLLLFEKRKKSDLHYVTWFSRFFCFSFLI